MSLEAMRLGVERRRSPTPSLCQHSEVKGVWNSRVQRPDLRPCHAGWITLVLITQAKARQAACVVRPSVTLRLLNIQAHRGAPLIAALETANLNSWYSAETEPKWSTPMDSPGCLAVQCASPPLRYFWTGCVGSSSWSSVACLLLPPLTTDGSFGSFRLCQVARTREADVDQAAGNHGPHSRMRHCPPLRSRWTPRARSRALDGGSSVR